MSSLTRSVGVRRVPDFRCGPGRSRRLRWLSSPTCTSPSPRSRRRRAATSSVWRSCARLRPCHRRRKTGRPFGVESGKPQRPVRQPAVTPRRPRRVPRATRSTPQRGRDSAASEARLSRPDRRCQGTCEGPQRTQAVRCGRVLAAVSEPVRLVANYQLELGFGFVDSAPALRRLRSQQLRSHLEAPAPAVHRERWSTRHWTSSSPHSTGVHAGGQRGRVYRMVTGYFEDMSAVFAGLAATTTAEAKVAVVVGPRCSVANRSRRTCSWPTSPPFTGSKPRRCGSPEPRGCPSSSACRVEPISPPRESIVLLSKG